MKILVALFVTLFLCVGAAAVGADDITTGRGVYVTPITPFTNWLNNNDDFYHKHNVAERETPIGIGTDILLWDNKHVGVTHEYKYDINNEEHSNYFVVGNRRSVWSWIVGNNDVE